MSDKTKRALFLCLRITATAAVFVAAAAVLYIFEYFQEWTQVDNITGALPIAFALLFVVGCTVLIWMKYTRKNAPFAIVLAVFVLLTAVLYPNSLRGNWWFNYNSADGGDYPDLSLYEPFKEDTLAASLNEKSTLSLSGDDLPVLDGATALYPLYAAFAQAVYDEDSYNSDPSIVSCSKTSAAYERIISGDADIIFVYAPSESQLEAAKDAGADLRFIPIALEAFVFIVGESNPIESVTSQQIYNIYTGKTAKWSTLGWEDGGNIIKFRRPDGSGSESGLSNIVMKGRPTVAAQPIPSEALNGSNSLMQQVSVWYNGVQPGLGYSYRYFAQTMYPNTETKLLSIDEYAPSDENIQNGNYPFIAEAYAVTRGKPEGMVAELLEWILSSQGQYLVELTGYTRVSAASAS